MQNLREASLVENIQKTRGTVHQCREYCKVQKLKKQRKFKKFFEIQENKN